MATNIAWQSYRNIDIQLLVRDFAFNVIDEISGAVDSISYSINADSDIRRTANVSMLLKSDRSKNGVLNDVYFASGNGYWFDKYVEIKVAIEDSLTSEYKWYKLGVYLINEPSINYDATNNAVSFQAVDLMSKMTGMRNGHLSGLATAIPTVDENGYATGATVVGAMTSLVSEQGFNDMMILEPPQNVIPSDIRVEANSSTYELLAQLRDINPNWEMFFTVDGAFQFKQIEDGQANDGGVYPTIIADDDDWDRLLISYSIATKFEDVKNYVEIYGHAYDIDGITAIEVSEADVNNGTIEIAYSGTISANAYTDFAISIVGDIEPIHKIAITDSAATYEVATDPCIVNGNSTYIIRVGANCVFLGDFQPCAIAWEDNPSSPFYVGEIANAEPNEYSSLVEYKYGDRVKFGGDVYRAIVNTPTVAPPDTNCWVADPTFVWNYNLWDIATHYYEGEVVVYNGSLWLSMQPNEGQAPVDYIDTYWFKLNSLVAPYNKLPTFTKMVRGVYNGGDYDNIYTAKMAEDMARYQLYKDCKLHDTITITCVPMYDLDVNRLIGITLPNEDTMSYWLIKQINTTISSEGTQTITAMRYYPYYPCWSKSHEYQLGTPFVPRNDLYPGETVVPRNRI